jgi:hypothetical protein
MNAWDGVVLKNLNIMDYFAGFEATANCVELFAGRVGCGKPNLIAEYDRGRCAFAGKSGLPDYVIFFTPGYGEIFIGGNCIQI